MPKINDWTKETLVLDVVNSLGEKYHFEIPPNADANEVSSRGSARPDSKSDKAVIVTMQLPLF